MKLVVIESPYAGDIDRNVSYARACMADSFRRGEYPFASHLLYTQRGILDDSIPEERELGIQAGFMWGQHADLVAIYTDLGLTPGMLQGIRHAEDRDCPIEFRKLSIVLDY